MWQALDPASGRLVTPRAHGVTTALCPECAEPVVVRQRPGARLHFMHVRLSSTCAGGGGGPGDWHRDWQELAPVARREFHDPVTGRRADLVTRTGAVVEVQHSALDPAVALARTADHHASTGKPVTWILDGTRFAFRRRAGSTGPVVYKPMGHRGGLRVDAATVLIEPPHPLTAALMRCHQARVLVDVESKGHVLQVLDCHGAEHAIKAVHYKRLPRQLMRDELAANCADLVASRRPVPGTI